VKRTIWFRALAFGVVLGLGIASRRHHLGFALWEKDLGDALYAVAVYLAVGLLGPRLRAPRLAAIALAISFAVEFFQATGIPAQYARYALVRWCIGTQFAVHDLICYVVGVACIALADSIVSRIRQN